MELHHLHVAQGQPGAERHGQAVATLVARRRVVAVHGRPGPGGEQHRLGPNQDEAARPHVDHEHAGDGAATPVFDQLHGAVVLQPVYAPCPYLFGQPVDDLDARQIALVDGAVEGLPGEGLLMDGAVGVAVEEAPHFILQLEDARQRAGDQQPGQLLVVQPLAALDGVHEMTLDGIAGRQGHVVAALDHAGAAAFAEQPLDGHGDRKLRIPVMGMQRREQAGAARAQNQDVRGKPLQSPTPRAASAAWRRAAAVSPTAS